MDLQNLSLKPQHLQLIQVPKRWGPPNPLTTVTTATSEELLVLKCINTGEAITHKKHLKQLT